MEIIWDQATLYMVRACEFLLHTLTSQKPERNVFSSSSTAVSSLNFDTSFIYSLCIKGQHELGFVCTTENHLATSFIIIITPSRIQCMCAFSTYTYICNT